MTFTPAGMKHNVSAYAFRIITDTPTSGGYVQEADAANYINGFSVRMLLFFVNRSVESWDSR